jgi:hypothetical protein
MLYAIKHKNNVVLGPLEWNKKYFEKVLKIRYSIDTELPVRSPLTLPLIVDESTSIHEAIVNQPDIDTMTQAYHGPFWDLTNVVIVANYEVHNLEIDSARNNFRALAAVERYKKEISNVKVEVQGVNITADTSRDGRNIFFQKFVLMGEDSTVNWKFPEAWLTLTKQELGLIVQVGAAHIQASFDWEKNINDQIDAAETAEQLYAIDIVEEPQEALEQSNDADQ